MASSTAFNTRLCRKRAEAALRDGDFAFALDHNYGTHRCVHFVVAVPFDPKVSENFAAMRAALITVKHGGGDPASLPRGMRAHPALVCDDRGPCAVDDDYMEKDALRWFALDHLVELVGSGGHGRDQLRLRPALVPTLRLVAMKLNALREQ